MARFKKLAVAIALVSVGAILGMHFAGSMGEQAGNASDVGGGFALVAPAFAQTVGRSFLEDEAGISVYVKIDQSIDLDRARDMYNVLEDQTDDYVIGTIKLLDYDETWWPHVWIRRDGWIVVYYNRAEPTSKLMHWAGYRDGRITTTTLREALLSVGRELGLSISMLEEGLRYYHWQHPDATRMLVVVGTSNFRYTIPAAITVRDASWSFRASVRSTTSAADATIDLVVDGTRIARVAGRRTTVTRTRTGDLDGRYLTPGDAHEVSMPRGGRFESGSQRAALIFIHR